MEFRLRGERVLAIRSLGNLDESEDGFTEPVGCVRPYVAMRTGPGLDFRTPHAREGFRLSAVATPSVPELRPIEPAPNKHGMAFRQPDLSGRAGRGGQLLEELRV